MVAILADSQLLVGRAVGSVISRENQSDNYVEVPPALIVTASDGKNFTFGNHCEMRGNWMEFDVLVDDKPSGEHASRIVYSDRKVKIYGRDGWRVWTGKGFV